jgi:hypothetical protein
MFNLMGSVFFISFLSLVASISSDLDNNLPQNASVSSQISASADSERESLSASTTSLSSSSAVDEKLSKREEQLKRFFQKEKLRYQRTGKSQVFGE